MNESRIHNRKKQHKQYFIADRELMRDKRLSAEAKYIFIVLSSLAETCENVCPSYHWIAKEIGYETEGKTDRAIYDFVARKIEELEKFDFIKRLKKNKGYDYEVYDYVPFFTEEKSSLDTEEKSSLDTEEKSSPSNKRLEKRINTLSIGETGKKVLEEENLRPKSWKDEILNHSLFEVARHQKFPKLTDEQILFTLDLIRTKEVYKHRIPEFTTCLNFLQIENDLQRKDQILQGKEAYYESKKNTDPKTKSSAEVYVYARDYRTKKEYYAAIEEAHKTSKNVKEIYDPRYDNFDLDDAEMVIEAMQSEYNPNSAIKPGMSWKELMNTNNLIKSV